MISEIFLSTNIFNLVNAVPKCPDPDAAPPETSALAAWWPSSAGFQQNPSHPYPKLKEKKVCWDAFCFATDAAPAGAAAAAEAAAPAASAAASVFITASAVVASEAAAEAAGAAASAAAPAPAGAASVAKQRASQQTFVFF